MGTSGNSGGWKVFTKYLFGKSWKYLSAGADTMTSLHWQTIKMKGSQPNCFWAQEEDQVKRIGNITQSLFAAKLNPYYQRKWLLLPAKIYELILFLVNLLFSLILHGKYSGYSRFFFPRNSGTMELQKHVESWYLQNNGGKWQNNGKLTKVNPTLFHSLWFSKPQHKQLLTSAKINIES